MGVVRTNFLRRQSVTIPNNGSVTFDVEGPSSPAEPPYAEGTDHVTRLRQLRENESGNVRIGLDATLGVAATLIDSIEIWARNSVGQSGLSAPLFPSGATPSANGAAYMIRSVFSATPGVPSNDAQALTILGGVLNNDATKDTPGIWLEADQMVRITLTDTAGGGDVTGDVTAKYDLGLNPAVGGSQP